MKILPINHERFREVHEVEIHSVQQTFTEKLLRAKHLARGGWFTDLYDDVSAGRSCPCRGRNGILKGRVRHWVPMLFSRHTVG